MFFNLKNKKEDFEKEDNKTVLKSTNGPNRDTKDLK